jgi:AAA family ATP:ADP antiporter
VLRQIPHQESVDLLTRSLKTVEPAMKYFIVKALNSLRVKYPQLKFDQKGLEQVLLSETKSYYEILQVLQVQRDSEDNPAAKLLKRALEEKQNQNLERLFRLLGLVYPPRDIYNAYQGIVSGRKALHASALEFLDNLLHSDVKKYILPIIDEQPSEIVLRKGKELFQLQIRNRNEAISYLIGCRDTWLSACAIYNTLYTDSPELLDLVKRVADDPDPVVSETARHVLTKRQIT